MIIQGWTYKSVPTEASDVYYNAVCLATPVWVHKAGSEDVLDISKMGQILCPD